MVTITTDIAGAIIRSPYLNSDFKSINNLPGSWPQKKLGTCLFEITSYITISCLCLMHCLIMLEAINPGKLFPI